MLLSDYRQLFRQYVTQTASFYDIHEEYVEKDYWLVLLLKHILSRDCGYVFKGGTSLSKCYRLKTIFLSCLYLYKVVKLYQLISFQY